MHPGEPTDAEILKASLSDPERFAEVFRRHHDALFAYVARRAGREAAADLTADVFLRAFTLRDRYDLSRASCRPWLYGIATNVIGDHLRRSGRRHRTYVAPFAQPGPDHAYPESEERLAAQALAGPLNRALGSLSRKDRDTLLLYALGELTYPEVAEALGIPVGTVRSRLARARERMRELLGPLDQMLEEEAGSADEGRSTHLRDHDEDHTDEP